jgi:hypothetical protein
MQTDAYEVAVAMPPQPPDEPDPQQAAREARQALFRMEQPAAWTAPLHPSRGSRQHIPVPAENSGILGAEAAERGAMCILGPDGAHRARGLHCPHDLPRPGAPDEITRVLL